MPVAARACYARYLQLSSIEAHTGDSMKLNNTVVTLALLGVLAISGPRRGAAPCGEPRSTQPILMFPDCRDAEPGPSLKTRRRASTSATPSRPPTRDEDRSRQRRYRVRQQR